MKKSDIAVVLRKKPSLVVDQAPKPRKQHGSLIHRLLHAKTSSIFLCTHARDHETDHTSTERDADNICQKSDHKDADDLHDSEYHAPKRSPQWIP